MGGQVGVGMAAEVEVAAVGVKVAVKEMVAA